MELKRILFLAGKSTGRSTVAKGLSRPASILRKTDNREEFVSSYRRAASLLSDFPELFDLLGLNLATSFLLRHDHVPGWFESWANENIDPFRDIFEISGETATSGRWVSVPVFLAGDRDVSDLHFVAGLVCPETSLPVACPVWAERIMSGESLQAVRDTARLCIEKVPPPPGFALFCYPLAVANDRVQIQGRSLALPLALAFMCALRGRPFPAGFSATGGLRYDGKTEKVGMLSRKVRRAAATGEPSGNPCGIFLYPAPNAPCPETGDRGPKLFPVRDLNQAWMLLELYSPEKADLLYLFSAMLADPDRFAEGAASVPSEWLDWARQNSATYCVLEKIVQSPERFSRLAGKLADAVEKNRLKQALAVSKLIDPEKDLQMQSVRSPLATFQWASANLCLCNHLGRVSRADSWAQRAEKLLDPVIQSDISAAADYFNYRFVALHNRYRFEPQLPRKLASLLEHLEKQYRNQCEFGCPTYPILGALYGTVAQNYAFCGPGFLEKTVEFFAKARKALGEDTVPENRENWVRQYNYQAYALLDAGESLRARARQAFFAYVGLEPENDFRVCFDFSDKWRHALTARFLADAGTDEERKLYRDFVFSRLGPATTMHAEFPDRRFPGTEPAHPWQLWHFNMGRIALAVGGEQEAQSWFEASLRICESKNLGPTVRVMALLPLAWLAQTKRLSSNQTREREDSIKRAAEKLTPYHFEPLFQTSFDQFLEKLRSDPGRFFPFNYR